MSLLQEVLKSEAINGGYRVPAERSSGLEVFLCECVRRLEECVW
jgi:hypothetical protein